MAKTYTVKRSRREFPLIDEGEYPAVICQPEAREDRKGERLVECRVKIVGGEENGTMLPHFYSLKDSGIWKLFDDMLNLGLTEEGEDLTEAEIVGLLEEVPCVATVETDEDTRDEPFSKAVSFRPRKVKGKKKVEVEEEEF